MFNHKNQIRALVIYFALTGIILLIIIHAYFSGGFLNLETWKKLIVSLVPELLGALVTFILVYFLFVRIGINIDDTFEGVTPPPWLINGFEIYSDINWTSYIEKSEEIIIIAFYIDNWVENNTNSLSEFIKKDHSNIVVFLPNYRNEDLISEIIELIPIYSKRAIEARIALSIEKIKKITSINSYYSNKIKIYLYDKPFNYTLELFDKRELFISINELYREKDYRSPFIQINLLKSPKLTNFINDEIKILIQRSNLINLDLWTE